MKKVLFLICFLTLRNPLSAQTDTSRQISEIVVRQQIIKPTAVAYLKKNDLQKVNFGQDLPVMLGLQTAVVSTTDAGAGIGYTGLRIRGSDATRINVTMNGIPMNDAESHAVFWVNLPDLGSSVSNLTIQRGIGTSSNGAAAFGATINLDMHKNQTEPYFETNNAVGSFKTIKNNVLFGTGLLANNRLVVEGRMSNIVSDGYIDRAASNLQSLMLSAKYKTKKWGDFRANITLGKQKTYQAWYGLADSLLDTKRTFNEAGMYANENGKTQFYDNQTDNYQQNYYQLFYDKRFKKINFNAAIFYTKGKGFFEEYKPNQSFRDYQLKPIMLGNDTLTNTDLIRRRWLDNDFLGTIFSFNYTKNRMLIDVGGGYNVYFGKHFGEIIWAKYASNSNIRQHYYDAQSNKKDANLYTKINYSINNKFVPFVDLQVRIVDYYTKFIDERIDYIPKIAKYTFFNPKIGLTSYINKRNTIYAFAGIGNREPLRDDFINSSENARPKPERMYNFEVGHKLSHERFMFASNVYLMAYKDQMIPTGAVNDVGALTRINTPKSHRIGLELEAAFEVSKQLKIGGNAAFSQNKIAQFDEFAFDYADGKNYLIKTHKNTDIAFSPRCVAATTIQYLPAIMGKKLSLTLLSKYVSKQYLDNTQNPNKQLKAYFVNDLNITYTHKKYMTLGLFINNLASTLYVSNGYTYSYYYAQQLSSFNYVYPQATRNFMLQLGLKF